MAFDTDHDCNKLFLEKHEKDVNNLANLLQAYKCDVTMLPLGLHLDLIMLIKKFDFVIVINIETICQHIAQASYQDRTLDDIRNFCEQQSQRLAIVQFDYTNRNLGIPGIVGHNDERYCVMKDLAGLLDKIHYPVKHQSSSIAHGPEGCKLAGSMNQTKHWLHMQHTDDAECMTLYPRSLVGPEPSMVSMETGLMEDYIHDFNLRGSMLSIEGEAV